MAFTEVEVDLSGINDWDLMQEVEIKGVGF